MLENSNLANTLTVVRACKNPDKKDMETRKYFIPQLQDPNSPSVNCGTYEQYAEFIKQSGQPITHIRLLDVDGVYIVDVATLVVKSVQDFMSNN